jgi:hypothetical protein
MRRETIDRLSTVDEPYLVRFSLLPRATQQQIVDATLAPALDPAVPTVDRQIAEARAKQLEAAMRPAGKPRKSTRRKRR